MCDHNPPIQGIAPWAGLLCLGLIAVIPFLVPYHRLPLPAFYSEWVAFVLGIAACFPFLFKNTWLHLEIPNLAIWLCGLVFLIAVQSIVVPHQYAAQPLLPGLYLVWAALLIVLCGWIRKRLGPEKAVTAFAWLIVVGSFLLAITALIQYFSGGIAGFVTTKQGISVYGNIGQRNHFATEITLASFALIYLHATERLSRTLTLVALILFGFVLTLSGSRTAVTYIVAAVVLAYLFYRATRNQVHYRLLKGASLLLVIFIVLQYALPFVGDWLKQLFGLESLVGSQRPVSEGVGLRVSEWRKAWLMFISSPVWGIGVGQYGWYSFDYQSLPQFYSGSDREGFGHSHNLVLQLLAELGIVGTLLVTLMAVAWFRSLRPVWKNTEYWLILTSIAALLLHSMVEFPLWYSFFLGIAAVFIGFGSEQSVEIKFTPVLGQIMAGAIISFCAAILAITLLGFRDLGRVNELIVTSGPEQASATLYAISKNAILTPWAEAAIVQHGAPDRDALDLQLAMTTRVARYQPTPIAVNRQIIYSALAGRSADTSTLIKKAFAVYPSDFRRLACYWKTAPAEEIRHLWQDAEKLMADPAECRTPSATSASAS